jgi:transcriptional regulator with XRE-family HTH domain
MNMTQSSLAESAGIPRTALAKIESGSRAVSADELARLAEQLSRPMDWFVGRNRAGKSNEGGPAGFVLQLSDRQQNLLDVLHGRDGVAADLYVGAVLAMASERNPVGVRQAAFSLRELIHRLGRHVGVVPTGPRLKERVFELQDSWTRAKAGSAEAVGARLAAFAEELDDFFSTVEEDRPGRREEAKQVLHRLDPTRRLAPPPVESGRVEFWMHELSYFNRVAHGGTTDPEEFINEVGGFEAFLLEWLRPSTFADFAAIDRLLAEGPPK